MITIKVIGTILSLNPKETEWAMHTMSKWKILVASDPQAQA
jgi:hypothetical protein